MKIETVLGKEEKDRLTRFLIKNKDVFAWSSADMLGIDPDFICHRLSITPETEVKGGKAKGSQRRNQQVVDD
ncbi:hypothetical protein CR513_14436, partial [Mucuna pruriens]